jgi:hypothetical protein
MSLATSTEPSPTEFHSLLTVESVKKHVLQNITALARKARPFRRVFDNGNNISIAFQYVMETI